MHAQDLLDVGQETLRIPPVQLNYILMLARTGFDGSVTSIIPLTVARFGAGEKTKVRNNVVFVGWLS